MNDKRWLTEWALPGVLTAVTLLGMLAVYDTSTKRELTPLENFLFQVIVLVFGVLASYAVGRTAARTGNQGQARSALNRVVTLYRGVGAIMASIESRREFLRARSAADRVPISHVEGALDLLYVQAASQLGSVDDAISDWAEVIPKEVAAVRAELEGRPADGAGGRGRD